MTCERGPWNSRLEGVAFEATVPAYTDPRPIMQAVRVQSDSAGGGSSPSTFAGRIIEGVVIALVIGMVLKRF